MITISRRLTTMTDAAGKNFIDLTAGIVSAYLSISDAGFRNSEPDQQIHAALLRVS